MKNSLTLAVAVLTLSTSASADDARLKLNATQNVLQSTELADALLEIDDQGEMKHDLNSVSVIRQNQNAYTVAMGFSSLRAARNDRARTVIHHCEIEVTVTTVGAHARLNVTRTPDGRVKCGHAR